MAVAMCQRPERALFISTDLQSSESLTQLTVCQRPERALFIST